MTNKRILVNVPLRPAIGSRFQPTGFPDLGPGEFTRPIADGGRRSCLLVESPQSMANHLEGMAWDDGMNEPVRLFDGLPYVRVVRADTGEYVTSSRTESHRLASAFIKDSTIDGVGAVDVIGARLGLRNDAAIDHRSVAAALFRLDPFVLIHGVFLADKRWPGQPKIARAVSSFIEAIDVERADSGGVKRDHVRHAIDAESGGSAEGYGSVPFARTEWTAAEIIASFSIDLQQLESYGLGEVAMELLRDIALWEVRSLLADGMRLRTACDLVPIDDKVVDQDGHELPSVDALVERIQTGIAGVAQTLDGGAVLDAVWSGGKKATKRGSETA
ncbi:MAG: type I-U CRISPR-associated RAMP protein Csb1/Cas7u [Ilumatobacteraceae bacterium]